MHLLREVFLMKKPVFSLQVVNFLNAKDRVQPQLWEHMSMICPGVRVLVVDDEPMNLMVAQGILGDYRMTVKTAQSGAEAIAICDNEDFDLLFLDHMMPQMDGVETLHHIRKLLDETERDITVIAFTANAVSGAREMFYREGFDEFISKSFYKQNNFCLFLDIVKTLQRERLSPRIFMLSNTIDKNSEYFDELECRDFIDICNIGDKIEYTTNKGTPIYVEIAKVNHSENKRKLNTLFYGFKNNKLASITGEA